MEDLVHRVDQAEAEVVHAHVVVVHPADHEAHAAEASHVVDVPNPNHQRVVVAPSQSK